MSLHYNVFEEYLKCGFEEKTLTFPIEILLSVKFKAAVSIQTQVTLSCLSKEIVSKPFQVVDVSNLSIVLDEGVEFVVLLNAQDSMTYRRPQHAKYKRPLWCTATYAEGLRVTCYTEGEWT